MRRVLRGLAVAGSLAAMVGCGGGGGGGSGGGGGGGGGGDGSAAGTLCDQLVTCGVLPSSAKSLCVQSLGMYVPDPTAAKECVDGLKPTCADVEDPTKLKQIQATCLYDTTKFSCPTGTTLNMCSPATSGHASVCKNLDCPSACESLLGMSGSCGPAPDDPWDKCLCGG